MDTDGFQPLDGPTIDPTTEPSGSADVATENTERAHIPSQTLVSESFTMGSSVEHDDMVQEVEPTSHRIQCAPAAINTHASENEASSSSTTTYHLSQPLQTKLAKVMHKCLKPNTGRATDREIQQLDEVRYTLKCCTMTPEHLQLKYKHFVHLLLKKIPC